MRLLSGLALVLLVATRGSAHVIVLPEASATGAQQRYTLVVPTEGRSPTVRVELRIPMGVDVASVEAKPGWEATNEAFPIGGATIGWSGGKIPPGQMLSFEFLAVNPPAPRTMTWNATQWYEDGTSERWGEREPTDHPGSTTTLTKAAAAADARPSPSSSRLPAGPGDGGAQPEHHDAAAAGRSAMALWIAVAALVVSAAALGVAVAGRRRS